MKKLPINNISFFLFTSSLLITCFTVYVHKNFLDVNLEQLIFNMALPVNGFNDHYLKSALKFSIFYIIISILFYIFICKNLLEIFFLKITGRAIGIKYPILLLSILFFISSIIFFNYKFSTYEIFKNHIEEDNPFIENNYSVPRNDIHFAKKNNLVVILVESMENTFSDKNENMTLTINLDGVKKKSPHTEHMVEIFGANWTIGAFTAWSFGLPLKLPKFVDKATGYISRWGFLPHARSIFDELHDQGYQLVMVMGSDSRYSGLERMLVGHGNFNIKDKQYWEKQNFSLEKHGGTGWGYSDKFVLDRALEEYKTLSESGKPFALFVQTIDTHSPDGYCPEEKKRFHDIRDAIIETDFLLGNFITSYRQIACKSDILAILGDHYFMGPVDFAPGKKERTLYNAFYGDIPPVPNEKKDQLITALDIAPTLLYLAGAKWQTNQFGLGVNLFSKDKSLTEKYGKDQFSKMLAKYSEFYSRFY